MPFNDLDAMAAAIDEETVAVMLEPVQGDAGVIPATSTTCVASSGCAGSVASC